MPYRRAKRPTWFFQARTRTGWKQLSTRTPDKRLAEKIEAMWEELANEHRAWDLLEPVMGGTVKIGTLFDMWVESGRKVVELRRRMSDVDLEPLIADFLEVHEKKVRPDTLKHIEVHVRTLIPTEQAFPRSSATPELLTKKLYAYKGKPGTVRKVHSDWSGFFDYCVRVRKLFDRNPMEQVDRPPPTKPPIRFYELDVVERIVNWQPTPERRALMALLYGTGIEISVALRLTRADVYEKRKEVRGAGTKTHTRDRMARVADWSWSTFWAHVKTLTPGARLFPESWTRSGAYFWHERTVGWDEKRQEGLKLTERLPLKNARHHWAVRQLRAGAPIKLVQEQLGHASPKLTLDTYGQFRPSGQDRDRWERAATEYEDARRQGLDPASTGAPEGISAADSATAKPSSLTNSRGGT